MNYKQNSDNFKSKARELVEKMTVEEAASQLRYDSPAIPRLEIPAYNWCNEALHGVARAGTATMFPQPIGLAAMFDETELFKEGEIIATEARAKFNAAQAENDCDIYKGLTFWSPNINIFRDPRWGRGHETFGEDPYLTARLGVAYVDGLQGNGIYMKAAACAKHFAVHSGPQVMRHEVDVKVSLQDLVDTYLPAFRALVCDAEVEGIMGAFNAVNGEPCCANTYLMEDILRNKWKFDGYFVSDCGAIDDFHNSHKFTSSPYESAAVALKKGCDLNCGNTYKNIITAFHDGLITESEIKIAAVRLFTTRFKLGLFDKECIYNAIPYTENDTISHNMASLKMSEKSIVMLKNDNILPLSKEKLHTIGVIGPNANSITALIGNFSGTASQYVTNLEGIKRYVGNDVRVLYAEGCHISKSRLQSHFWDNDGFSEAIAVAKNSSVIVLCLGLDETIEGDESDICGTSGDRVSIALPESQQRLLKAICEVGKPVILVLNNGSALDLRYADKHCKAILEAWYSGSHGGTALANVLFGEVSPSGKLPITFYNSDDDLPDFEDYSMENRTYRYFVGESLYPFGYGLSYTTFFYSDLETNKSAFTTDEDVKISVKVTNIGAIDAREIVEVYVHDERASVRVPEYKLCKFRNIMLKSGETRVVTFIIEKRTFDIVDAHGDTYIENGKFSIFAGGCAPCRRSHLLTGSKPLHTFIEYYN